MTLDKLIKATINSVPFLKPTDYHASTLVFKNPTNLTGVDGFGNPIFTEESVTILARLFEDRSASRVREVNVGSAIASQFFRGQALQPKQLPDWLLEGSKGVGVVNGNEGDIILLAAHNTSMPAYSQNFGEIIEISFTKRIKQV